MKLCCWLSCNVTYVQCNFCYPVLLSRLATFGDKIVSAIIQSIHSVSVIYYIILGEYFLSQSSRHIQIHAWNQWWAGVMLLVEEALMILWKVTCIRTSFLYSGHKIPHLYIPVSLCTRACTICMVVLIMLTVYLIMQLVSNGKLWVYQVVIVNS